MTTSTTNLGLKTYNSTTDASATFINFRSDLDGISPTSNMGLIDSWAGLVNGSLISLGANAIYTISATYISSNYYEATSAELTSYATDVIIALTLNTTNSGTVTLNINALGTKTLQKIDVNGNIANLDASELKKNKLYLFKYSGTSWVWIGATSADQISASGITTHLMMISGCGVLIDSGISASSVALSHISASSITSYGEDGNLLMISGSGEYSTIADSEISTYDFVSASAIPAYGDNGNFLMISGSGEDAIMSDSGISMFDVVSMYSTDVTLYSGSWTSASQVVSIAYMTASAIVMCEPVPTLINRSNYTSADIFWYSKSSGSLTFKYASASPTSDIDVNVIYVV